MAALSYSRHTYLAATQPLRKYSCEGLMAGHAVDHDYHLIPPSPWPFLSGMACLVWGLGMVVFFAGLVDRTGESPMMEFFFGNGLDTLKSTMVGDGSVSGGWIILLIGCLFASYVMYGWWKDCLLYTSPSPRD